MDILLSAWKYDAAFYLGQTNLSCKYMGISALCLARRLWVYLDPTEVQTNMSITVVRFNNNRVPFFFSLMAM